MGRRPRRRRHRDGEGHQPRWRPSARSTPNTSRPSCSTCRACATTASIPAAWQAARRAPYTSARKTASSWSTRTSAAAGCMCMTGCPYKKVYYNWSSGKAEKCIFCYPRIESGCPTVCSEACTGRIRYIGVVLYDADKIKALASIENDEDLYEAQRSVFLDPFNLDVIEGAPSGRHIGRVDRGRPEVSRAQAHRMGARIPDAPRIPHASDGLVRPAALSRCRRRRCGQGVDGRRAAEGQTSSRFRFSTSPTCLPAAIRRSSKTRCPGCCSCAPS